MLDAYARHSMWFSTYHPLLTYVIKHAIKLVWVYSAMNDTQCISILLLWVIALKLDYQICVHYRNGTLTGWFWICINNFHISCVSVNGWNVITYAYHLLIAKHHIRNDQFRLYMRHMLESEKLFKIREIISVKAI